MFVITFIFISVFLPSSWFGDVASWSSFTSKLNSKTVSVLPSVDPSLIFPFQLLPYPAHPTGFSFYIFSGFLVIFILLSSNKHKLCPFSVLLCNILSLTGTLVFPAVIALLSLARRFSCKVKFEFRCLTFGQYHGQLTHVLDKLNLDFRLQMK